MKQHLVQQLAGLGQSIWYDNIERRLLESGELLRMAREGEIRGLTSNPSIFQAAIARSADYDAALLPMAWSGRTAQQIFDRLAYEDIVAAADVLRPLYDETHGGDGYVSLEVSPDMAHDTAGTLEQAKRLWAEVDRPNLMIKIPATPAGLPAIQAAIAAGLNVNVTLIFSIVRYQAVMEAYLKGLEERLAAGLPLGTIASVASFFISRMDSKVDKRLEEIVRAESEQAATAQSLMGKSAIANARLAYAAFQQTFAGPRWDKLSAAGAQLQRPLWASTSTKNPAYPDTLYVDSLIGPHTVNTVPPQTLAAYLDHGQPSLTLETGLGEARQTLQSLEDLGIHVDNVTQELEDEGVAAFLKAYQDLLDTIEQRRSQALLSLGDLANGVIRRVASLDEQRFAARMQAHDPTLWTDEPTGQAEVRIRLGWLNLPYTSRELLPRLAEIRTDIAQAGFTHAMLLGMGGSSLAPEVLSLVFDGTPRGEWPGLNLAILDSTEPSQVLAALERAPLDKTLFIVASKSGGTAEVNAFMEFFWSQVESQGKQPGRQFVAITDPGTAMESLARQRGFRHVLLADPNVGGRYSALSAFGMLPAALMGLDADALLNKAAWLADQCQPAIPAWRNPGLVFGALIGEAALAGRDKLTIWADAGMSSVGGWIEQLVAESSGKLGKGITPVDGEMPASPEMYGSDRLFVYLRTDGSLDDAIGKLRAAGQPAVTLPVRSQADLAAEFYRWEYATAVACAMLGVNAFDQPDVQDAKTRTKAQIAAYQQLGRFDEGQPVWEGDGWRVYASPAAASIADATLSSPVDAFKAFNDLAGAGDYIAINAFVPRNPQTSAVLSALQAKLRNHTGKAVTSGFGPRFLHSTGQLHKGGPDQGLFLVITVEPAADATIPGQGIGFAALVRGQALGDIDALQARGRRILRLHLPHLSHLEKLAGMF